MVTRRLKVFSLQRFPTVHQHRAGSEQPSGDLFAEGCRDMVSEEEISPSSGASGNFMERLAHVRAAC